MQFSGAHLNKKKTLKYRNLINIILNKLTASSFSRLETLGNATKATDDAVIQLALNSPLKCLVLSGISSMTDKVKFAIANL